MRSVRRGTIVLGCVLAVSVAAGLVLESHSRAGAPAAAVGVAAAGLKDGWSVTVPVPRAELGEGDRYVAWARDGWLQVRREKPGGETDWQVVLARATDPAPPVVEAPKGSVRFSLSYRGGRYFVREDAFLLRCLREPKPATGPWPALVSMTAPGGPAALKASAGAAAGPPAMRLWKSGDWIMAASGPAADRPDCVLRLCPADAGVEKSGGWGAMALAPPSAVRDVFYSDYRATDDGELLVANRLLARPAGPTVGEPAPPFSAQGLDGKPVALADLKGKYVLLDFWATWCGPCVAELPHVRELHDRFAGDGRLVVLGLSLDESIEVPARFAAERKLPWPQAYAGAAGESRIARDYGVESIPATFLIDPQGKVVARGLRGKELAEAVSRALR